MDALISAQAGTALLIQGSDLASIHANSPERAIPRRAEEAHLLFGEAQDLQVLEGVDRDEVVRRLICDVDSAEALQLLLILLDSELSGEIRSEAAEELDGLLVEDECRQGLERILFAHPLPQEAHLSGAFACSEQTPHVQNLLSHLADLQPSVAEVRRAWIALPDSLFASTVDRRRFQAVLVREGLFRELVLVRRAGTPVEFFLLSSVLNPVLRKLLGSGKRQELQRWLKPWQGGREGGKHRPLQELRTEDIAALARQALAGDQTALSRLVAALTPVVKARVTRTLLARRAVLAGERDLRQTVEDLSQEVFLALFSRDAQILRSWRAERGLSLANFVGLVTERQVISFVRSGRRNPWKEATAFDGDGRDDQSPDSDPEEGTASSEYLSLLIERLQVAMSEGGLLTGVRLSKKRKSRKGPL
jgi:DNA-directed RNA polymerase specialized sigma24 family protein